MSATMFERYGGFAKISQIVSSFYDRLLDSPVVSGYFDGTNMKKLIDHQTKFIAAVMGGPASYTNDALERAHAHLKIDQEAFDEMAALLKETLEDFGVDDSDVAVVHRDILSRSRFVISRQ